MKPLIKDTPKEDKPPNKGQAESTLVYILHRKSRLKEDNLSKKDKTTGLESCPYYSRTSKIQTPKIWAPPSTGQLICPILC